MTQPHPICLCCDKEIELLHQSLGMPDDATVWRSSGNYGSTKLDLMDDTLLQAYVCDHCLEKNKHKFYRIKKLNRGPYIQIDVEDVFQEEQFLGINEE